jgi:sec-independent protein translocase protein TatC
MLDEGRMALGEHLEELRWRLFRVITAVVIVLIAAFAFSADLKLFVLQPLKEALIIAGPEASLAVGLDPERDGDRLLKVKSLTESPITAFTISFYTALFAIVPYIVFQIWGFIKPALKTSEVGLFVLFLPTAILFFYTGAVLGYLFGLPWFYAWLIQWAAEDPTAGFILEQRHYIRFFVMMTVCFGVILDIPWLVLILVRMGLVTVQTLAANRRFVLLGAIVLAAVLSPPDPFSQFALFIPMVVLFEIGLFAARIMERRRALADG